MAPFYIPSLEPSRIWPDDGIKVKLIKAEFNEMNCFFVSYVKLKRDDRTSSITPPLSGPISPLGFPFQSVCNIVLNAKLILIVVTTHVKSLIIITQMTRRCLPLSALGVDEEQRKEKKSQMYSIKKGKIK